MSAIPYQHIFPAAGDYRLLTWYFERFRQTVGLLTPRHHALILENGLASYSQDFVYRLIIVLVKVSSCAVT
jgi:hypothetical protein